MNSTIQHIIGFVFLTSAVIYPIQMPERFVPDFRVKPYDYTILMAVDAQLSEGLKPFQPGGHGKFFTQGWKCPNQKASWTVIASDTADYAVNVLICRKSIGTLRIEVATDGKILSATLAPGVNYWQRITLGGLLPLSKGTHDISLHLDSPEGDDAFDAKVHSVELVRPAVRDTLHKKALAQRADTIWLQQSHYGIMVHWTRESMPRQGEPKSYEQAVNDFNVESFADQMKQTGAGFVVFTTSHAFQDFPAPLTSLEKILPGRTTKRDLVADLATALGKRGLKLMLYYHLGSMSDPVWLNASGFWETDTTRFFNNWRAIISEAGQRYGDKLAGWWFDDGAVSYYYRNAPWESLDSAAKTAHAERLVGFNPWELPSPTEYQDYFCGEGHADPSVGGLLPIGGDGHFKTGPHQGLQACATLITERDWVHSRKNTGIAPPKWNAEQLAEML